MLKMLEFWGEPQKKIPPETFNIFNIFIISREMLKVWVFTTLTSLAFPFFKHISIKVCLNWRIVKDV